jgi:hypothetical protein
MIHGRTTVAAYHHHRRIIIIIIILIIIIMIIIINAVDRPSSYCSCLGAQTSRRDDATAAATAECIDRYG